MQLGIRRGAALALDSQLQSGWGLHRLELWFPEGANLLEREALIGDFIGVAAHVAAEINVGHLLWRGASPDEDIV